MNPALLRYLIEGVKPLWGLRSAAKWGFRKPKAATKPKIDPVHRGAPLKGRPARPTVAGSRPTGPDAGGFFIRNPGVGVTGLLGLGTAGAGTAYSLLSGDDKPDEAPTGTSPQEFMRRREQAENDALAAKQPSMSAGHRSAYLKKRKKRLQKGMKQLLNQYMILSAVSPEQADNFLKAGMSMMEKDQEFNDDLQIQDAYDMVFQPGNMPTSGRDAFAKLLPYVGKKDAMAIAGDWSDLVPDYKEYNYMT